MSVFQRVTQPVRREFKYLMPKRGLMSATMLVRSRVPALTVQHPARQVTSVYFDTVNYECYSASVGGMSRRLKLRLRWYGDVTTPRQPVLEVKQRFGQEGWKHQYEIDGLDFQGMTWAVIRSIIAKQVPGGQHIGLESLRVPILISSYLRHYLATSDGAIRLTVDTSLRFIDQRHRPRPNFVFDAVEADFAVVECKIDSSINPDVTRLLRALELRWTRFSKYCYGVEALTGRVTRDRR